MKAFSANYNDLSGATNPAGVWSPAFLALKTALDHGDSPQNVIQAFYDWLGQRGINPSEVDAVLDLDEQQAYEALLGLISRKLKPKALPSLYAQTLRRALQQIAADYAGRETEDSKLKQLRAQSIRDRFATESAATLVSNLLD